MDPKPVSTPENLTSAQRGTIFPSLDGSSPGEVPAAGDITGVVLNDLIQGDDPVSEIATGGTLPAISPAAEPAAAEPVQVAGGEIQPPAARRKRTAEDRIAQLVRKYHDERENSSALETQLARLAEIVEKQNEQLTALRNPSTPRPPAASSSDPSGLGVLEGAAAPAQGTPVSANDIAAVVSKAIESYDQRRSRQEAQIAQLRASHEQSFDEACEEMPELRDARTRAHQTFMALYRQSPIRNLPDAPYQIALQVKGILADEARASGPAVEARKRQASVVTPSPSVSDIPDTQRAALQKAYNETCLALRQGDKDPRTFIKWRKLRAALQQRK